MKPYEDAVTTNVKVSKDNPEELNDLIKLLPESFQHTVCVNTPCDKYPNMPRGSVIEDRYGNILYFNPYIPLQISPFPKK